MIRCEKSLTECEKFTINFIEKLINGKNDMCMRACLDW